jgi:7-carboxy-7-deazaguanine synthase
MSEQASDRLRITEIFYSLQGEADSVGVPTVFVRLTGCPLRCGYCDTAYAFQGGEWMDLDQILEQVAGYKAHYVCVTGGEPLAQKACRPLLTKLCDAGYRVSLETCGAMDVNRLDPRVVKVMDIKTPASGEADKNRWCNLEHLSPADQIKFVICDRADFDWAAAKVREKELDQIATVWFSPSFEQVAPADLAAWILDEHLPVRMQLQLHKILWGDQPGV